MNRIQLAQLRDIAIEYLPEAQKASDNFKQWAKVKRLGSRDYALRLYQAASCSLGDASLPAVEIAAANLMQALALWETYDPNDVPQDDLTPDEIRKYCMEKIKETANTLAEVTGRDVAHLIPADTPAAKGKAVPVTSLSGDDWKEKAREIADECFDHDTEMECRDSLKRYSGRVMELMQKRGIKGPRGIIDNANYVMREALQSDSWWANKTK